MLRVRDDSVMIKSYPDLSLAVMRRRLEPEYRIWLLARYIDAPGRGAVWVKDLYSLVARYGLCTRKTVERTLKRTSSFWHKVGPALYLTGILKVAEFLGVTLGHRPVMIPLVDFGSMETLRAVFVASYMAEGPRTIAIDTLVALTGRSRRTIVRYLRSPHITKSPNVMRSVRRPSADLDPALSDQGYYRGRVNGRPCLVKRMPNTYETDLETAPRGMARRERQRPSCSTAEDPSPGEECSSSPTEGENSPYPGAPRRLYYSDAKRASRALESLSPQETIYVECTGRQEASGACLWRGYTLLERGGPIVSW